MLLTDFDYALPKELIAQYPLRERESARLLVLDRARRAIEHRVFRDIPVYVRQGDVVVLNDTRVMPSRLCGARRSGGKAEVLLLKNKQGLTFEALIKPSRVKIAEDISFAGGKVSGRITGKQEITFEGCRLDDIYGAGQMPLPPYIKRSPEEIDNEYYQTVYARQDGAVASPTAGLHFTHRLLDQMRIRGAQVVTVTLHVGLGTFRPVKDRDIRRHRMEPEYFSVRSEAAEVINQARRRKNRIWAVGTTALRTLESFAGGRHYGYTDLFIYPGYQFSSVDCLLTNFHLPRTTLLMLVYAFADKELVQQAYREAVERRYRFYSYGDAMLII